MRLEWRGTQGSGQGVEATRTRLPPLAFLDAPATSLVLDVAPWSCGGLGAVDTVYDVTGKGVAEAHQRVWSAPSDSALRNPVWLANRHLWRMLKFARRGHHVPHDVKRALYRFWMDNYEHMGMFNFGRVWDKVLSVPTPPRLSWLLTEGGIEFAYDESAVERSLEWFLPHVADDFRRLDFSATDAARFARMLLERDVLTTRSYARWRQAFSEHRRYRFNARLNDEVRRVAARLEERAVHHGETPSSVFALLRHMLDCGEVTTFSLYEADRSTAENRTRPSSC